MVVCSTVLKDWALIVRSTCFLSTSVVRWEKGGRGDVLFRLSHEVTQDFLFMQATWKAWEKIMDRDQHGGCGVAAVAEERPIKANHNSNKF
jgi:hypothetical protein